MNKADSCYLAHRLDEAGYTNSRSVETADIVLLNTCVVRESAETRAIHKLDSLKSLKKSSPHVRIVLTGCMVGSDVGELRTRFPWVDLFFPPQQWEAFDECLEVHQLALGTVRESACNLRFPVSALIPVVHGCDSYCSYCVVPYRRGRVRSRHSDDILREVEESVQRGAKEVCLLGQIVDQYGFDLPDKPDLADLLEGVNKTQGLERIRFLTSHPGYMSSKLIGAVARLDKVCEHISLPVQSGDNEVLKAMRRGYTAEQYLDLVHRIRYLIPRVSIITDVIVGFPGETEEQFTRTLDMLRQVRFDKVHIAAYSPRPETAASRTMIDSVHSLEKGRRRTLLENLQQSIAAEINADLVGGIVEVLVEGKKKDKWFGRTRGDKLVFFPGQLGILGELVSVRIEKASPFALQGVAL